MSAGEITLWVVGTFIIVLTPVVGFVLAELRRLGTKVAEMDATLNGNGARGLTGEVEKVREEFHEGNNTQAKIIGQFDVRLARFETDMRDVQGWMRGPQYGRPLGGAG